MVWWRQQVREAGTQSPKTASAKGNMWMSFFVNQTRRPLPKGLRQRHPVYVWKDLLDSWVESWIGVRWAWRQGRAGREGGHLEVPALRSDCYENNTFSPTEGHQFLSAAILAPSKILCVCTQSLQSCLTLCDPMDCSPPGSSVHGILQERIQKWVVMPSSEGSFRHRDWTGVSWGSCTSDRLFTTEPPGKPPRFYTGLSLQRPPWLRPAPPAFLRLSLPRGGGQGLAAQMGCWQPRGVGCRGRWEGGLGGMGHDSCRCMAEIITILESNYPPIKKQKCFKFQDLKNSEVGQVGNALSLPCSAPALCGPLRGLRKFPKTKLSSDSLRAPLRAMAAPRLLSWLGKIFEGSAKG